MSKARELAELSRTVSDSADAVAITIDSSENVTFAAGIDVTGTVTSDGLTVQTTNGLNALLESTTSYQYLQFKNSSATTNYIGFVNDDFVVNPPTGVKMTVTAEGNVGIGVSNPSDYNASWDDLVVGGTGSHGITIASGTTSSGTLAFADGTSGTAEYSGYIQYNHNTNLMAFGTNGAVAALNIDSAGNVLVGKTALGAGNYGFAARADTGGSVEMARDGGTVLYVNRGTSDGTLLSLRKDNAEVGFIGAVSGSLYIASPYANDSGLRFSDRTIHPCTTAGAPRDDAINLGYSAGRFDTIFAKAGSINTSDRNEKQDIEELSDAEKRVAVAAKSLLRKYRWKSAVAEKGDDARIHFGIIAQDLQAAFEAEGLDAARYGMWCSDTWKNDDGSEQTRLGVRYSELLAFIISAV